MTGALARTSRRLGLSAVLLVLLSFVVYVGVDLLPGDAVTAHLGPSASAERVAQARANLGLDRPVLIRYLDWAGGALHGDFGLSATGRPVGDMLSDRVGNSVLLAGLALLLLVPLSLVLGVVAAWRRARATDRVVSTTALLLVSVPEFVIASGLVVVFAVLLPLLPAVSLVPAGSSPLSRPEVLVLPVLGLMLPGLAYAVRVIRGTALSTVDSSQAEFLRLSGVPGRVVLRRAVVPAVLPVAVQVWVVTAVGMLGGAVLVERVFGYPGLGELLVSSVQLGDLPVVQALVLVLGALTLGGLVLADLASTLLTPRLRARGAR
ncbi:ABC transporter permease [Amycolatopsis endophytica]|uniref:Peptide/nickel transport system permease protein n=1 Tax=Amycolatopsis endophytica TaxID=860233 RepID=A0A853BDP5_9PSEU|nr:ABC transporter permease [Amycolatopsis endophytica]NYI93369.1 peptide/nickel transport system permease protein [Amycolatopsis endophytica]